MIRIENGDISDELHENIFAPFVRYMKKYIKINIINEFVAFYIAEGYNRDALVKCDLRETLKEAISLFCEVDDSYYNKEEIINILKERYKLEITEENPINIRELD